MSKSRVEAALRRGGRQRRIASLAASVVAALRVPQLRQHPLVEQAMRAEAVAMLGVLNAVCDSVDELAAALGESFAQHPDYEIITSFPGLADISGAMCSPRSAMTAPGSSTTERCRHSPDPRRSPAPRASPAPSEHYLRRRDRGDGHPAALRHLFNRMLGQPHHCLATGQTYDPIKAFPYATTGLVADSPPAAA